MSITNPPQNSMSSITPNDRRFSQPVDTLVIAILGVTLHPVPADLVRLHSLVKGLPKLGVSQGAVLTPPATLLPAFQPLGDAALKIF